MVISLIAFPHWALAQNGSAPNWTGLYAGINLGNVFNDLQQEAHHLGFTKVEDSCDASANFSNFFAGAQIGYAYQFASLVVLGIEGDFTHNLSYTQSLHCICPVTPDVADDFIFKNQQQGSIRGRVGYGLWNNQLLPFVNAGVSFADFGLQYNNEAGDRYVDNTVQSGWFAGAGVEWKFLHYYSLRLEYFYSDYGNITLSIPTVYGLYDSNGKATDNLHTNNLKVGFNYWF